MHQEIYLNKLRNSGLSNTRPRRDIFEVLLSSDHTPLAMSDLVERTSTKLDRATVYRSVEVLEKIGIIKRLHDGWKYKLELSDDFHGHHHHMTCTSCGTIHVTHDDEKLEKLLTEMSQTCGFDLKDHQVEMRGLCIDCVTLND